MCNFIKLFDGSLPVNAENLQTETLAAGMEVLQSCRTAKNYVKK